MKVPASNYEAFFKDQTVFLTDATGSLGGCLLHKLALELSTKKIFVLCRSETKAYDSWAFSMPFHIRSIFETGKVELVLGDIKKERFGIDADQLDLIAFETTVVINSTADISLAAKLPATIRANCLPPLELARLASLFPHLISFVQLSTGYSNSHLPDGIVEERLYPTGNAEFELKQSLFTGTTQSATRFPGPYAYSMHIMERLLMLRYPNLPILIVRPTIMGHAVKSPFPGYGPTSAISSELLREYMIINPGSGVFHPSEGHISGTKLFDEIPVDWVANIILLHIAAGTRGVVHAASGSWYKRTFDEILESFSSVVEKPQMVFMADRTAKQSFWEDPSAILTRQWDFLTKKSEKFKGVKGILSIDVRGVSLKDYDHVRVEKARRDIEKSRKPVQARL